MSSSLRVSAMTASMTFYELNENPRNERDELYKFLESKSLLGFANVHLHALQNVGCNSLLDLYENFENTCAELGKTKNKPQIEFVKKLKDAIVSSLKILSIEYDDKKNTLFLNFAENLPVGYKIGVGFGSTECINEGKVNENNPKQIVVEVPPLRSLGQPLETLQRTIERVARNSGALPNKSNYFSTVFYKISRNKKTFELSLKLLLITEQTTIENGVEIKQVKRSWVGRSTESPLWFKYEITPEQQADLILD